ncbi:RsiV family protein [Vibrio rumoiensis]|uniref:RsiV family protein n=1 Tax=Vibrio rumoiensis TaxID=76258 RepID=UPI0013A58143|nr:RsiV family protein [Vibrio rumoiensis]
MEHLLKSIGFTFLVLLSGSALSDEKVSNVETDFALDKTVIVSKSEINEPHTIHKIKLKYYDMDYYGNNSRFSGAYLKRDDINAFLGKDINSIKGDFFKNYPSGKKFINEFQLYEGFIQDYDESIEAATKNYISFSISQYESTGGAHGVTYTNYINYDFNNNEIITWEDMFDNNYEVNNYIHNLVFSFFNENDLDNKSEGINLFMQVGRFNITPKGLSIHYPSYSIAPYAYGQPHFFISKEKLKKFMAKSKYQYYFSKNPKLNVTITYIL